MNLEDSIGDIVRKARISTQTAAETAAAAAGVSTEVYQALESTGRAPSGFGWEGLGRLLTLDGGRLQRQHDGWRPAAVDLGRWRELRVITTAGDDVRTMSIIVSNAWTTAS